MIETSQTILIQIYNKTGTNSLVRK